MMKLMAGKRLALLIGSMMLLAVLLYRETAMAMWGLWMAEYNPTYSHGPLLLLVSLYILYREWRQHSDELHLKVSYVALICLVGSSLVWFVAGLGSVQLVQMLALISVLCFILIALLGLRQAKPFLFPVLLMIGAIPVWGILVKYLQTISAIVAGWITTATIRPSIREGMFIHIPAGSFEVTEGCSGIAYFIVSVIIGVLFVYTNQIALKKAVYFVLASMLVAIIANIIRVYVIVLSGQLTDMQSYFVQEEHFSLGWVIFAIGISIALWQAGRFLPAQLKQVTQNDSHNAESETRSPKLVQQPAQGFGIALLVVAIGLGPVTAEAYREDLSQGNNFTIMLPDAIGNYNKAPYTDTYHPEIQAGDASQEASYVGLKNDSKIYFYMNYFYSQHQGAEAVSDNNHLADRHHWRQLSSQVINPEVDGYSDVQESRLQARNGEKRIVWHWYETNNVRTSLHWLAKLHNVMGILKGDPSIRMVVVAVEPKMGLDVAQSQLRSFLQAAEGKFQIMRHKEQGE
jgi:EpsI family protein